MRTGWMGALALVATAAAAVPALRGDDAAWQALFKPAVIARAAAANGIYLSPYAPRGSRPKLASAGQFDGESYLATGALPGGGMLVVSGDGPTMVGTITFVTDVAGPAVTQKKAFLALQQKVLTSAGIRKPGIEPNELDNDADMDGFVGNDGTLNVPTGVGVKPLPGGVKRISVYYGQPSLPPS